MPEDNLDKYIEQLQKIIIEEEEREFNERIVNLYHNPKNWGKPPKNEISVSKAYEGPCGDTMTFFLTIENDIITKVHFTTDGCGASVAAGCQTTLLVENKPLDYAEKLTPEDVDTALNGLPEDHKHCAELAIRTLKRAIEDYRFIKN